MQTGSIFFKKVHSTSLSVWTVLLTKRTSKQNNFVDFETTRLVFNACFASHSLT